MQAPFFMAGINHDNENQTPTKTKNNKNKQTNKQKRPILILGVTFLLTDKEEYSMYCRMFSTVRLF